MTKLTNMQLIGAWVRASDLQGALLFKCAALPNNAIARPYAVGNYYRAQMLTASFLKQIRARGL